MRFQKPALLLAFAAASCVLASAAALAQSMEVVTVEAVREIIVGRTVIGAPIKEFSIRSRVSYADLDLTTAAGANELEKRIRDTAASSCKEIDIGANVPVEGWTTERCVKDAVAGAMAQAQKAIVGAKAAGK